MSQKNWLNSQKKIFFEIVKVSKWKCQSVRGEGGHKGENDKKNVFSFSCSEWFNSQKKSKKKIRKIFVPRNHNCPAPFSPILPHILRTRFFLDMRFSQKDQQQYALTFSETTRDN